MPDLQYTPGPWVVEYLPYPCATNGDGEPNPPAAFVGPPDQDIPVALVGAPEGEDPFDSLTQRANAALIAAVPELLEAVRASQSVAKHQRSCPLCQNRVSCKIVEDLLATEASWRAEALKKVYATSQSPTGSGESASG